LNIGLRFVLPAIVVLVIAACAPPPVLRNEKFLSDDSLVSGEPCVAPCWREITPGETGWSDALSILEDASDITLDPVQDDPESEAIGVQWKQNEGDVCCQMISENGDTVSLIFLQTAPNMTVGELVEAHGDPAYAIGNPVTDDQAVVLLVYPNQQMVVLGFVPGAEGDLSASSEIIGVWYITADNMDLFTRTNNLHEWDGYQPFSSYASDVDASEFDVTPSITLTPSPEG
jgi:hypothetical protein